MQKLLHLNYKNNKTNKIIFKKMKNNLCLQIYPFHYIKRTNFFEMFLFLFFLQLVISTPTYYNLKSIYKKIIKIK